MKKRINYKEAGVTLIALVITIIVITILAGITISSALGNDGILHTAQSAGEAYEQGERNDSEAIESYSDVYSRATSNEYNIYVDEQKQNLVTFFKDIEHTLLSSETNDTILSMNCENGYAEIKGASNAGYVIASNELHNTTTIDNAIEVKKKNSSINVDKKIEEYEDNWYITNCGFSNYGAVDYFLSEIETNRPHLYINGEDIGLEGWFLNSALHKYTSTDDSGSYLEATDDNNGTLYYNKSGNTITIKIRINNPFSNPSLQLSGFNASALTEFAIKYDDGRTYDRNTKEFMFVIWNLVKVASPGIQL